MELITNHILEKICFEYRESQFDRRRLFKELIKSVPCFHSQAFLFTCPSAKNVLHFSAKVLYSFQVSSGITLQKLAAFVFGLVTLKNLYTYQAFLSFLYVQLCSCLSRLFIRNYKRGETSFHLYLGIAHVQYMLIKGMYIQIPCFHSFVDVYRVHIMFQALFQTLIQWRTK